jgi:hypothetical protein
MAHDGILREQIRRVHRHVTLVYAQITFVTFKILIPGKIRFIDGERWKKSTA